MKKNILFLAAIIFANVAIAQQQYKPQAKDFTMEVQFRPLDILSNAPIQAITNGAAFGISPRFFITDRWELRADLLFGMSTQTNKDTLYDYYYYERTSEGIVKESESLLSFGLHLGANYHFKGTERVSPYVGATVGSGMITNISTVSTDYFNDVLDDTKAKHSGGKWYLCATAVTGFNWYITSGLYLGVEVGLGFNFKQNTNVVTKTTVGDEVTKDVVKPTEADYSVTFLASPAIRLGWKF
jgi:outer membrane protein W